MSYLNKYRWIVIPENLPVVIKNCPKCNEKMQGNLEYDNI